jgi:hypothetical protein
MIGEAHGTEYKFFNNLEEARKDPEAAMIMEADSGGQILVTCPVSKVHAKGSTGGEASSPGDLEERSKLGRLPEEATQERSEKSLCPRERLSRLGAPSRGCRG